MSGSHQGGPPSAALAAFGADVAARLDADPAVHKSALTGIDLYTRQNFLSPADCGFLIGRVDAGSRPSSLYSTGGDDDFRTSWSGDLERWDPGIRAIDTRICNLLGIDPAHGETMEGQRYEPGQQFKNHHDFFHVSEPYWPEQEKRGGQRSWTAMIYLNEPEEGGATAFPMSGSAIVPMTGMLLTWNNMNADGASNPDSLHAGMPVIRGVKYVVTKWFRERPWV